MNMHIPIIPATGLIWAVVVPTDEEILQVMPSEDVPLDQAKEDLFQWIASRLRESRRVVIGWVWTGTDEGMRPLFAGRIPDVPVKQWQFYHFFPGVRSEADGRVDASQWIEELTSVVMKKFFVWTKERANDQDNAKG